MYHLGPRELGPLFSVQENIFNCGPLVHVHGGVVSNFDVCRIRYSLVLLEVVIIQLSQEEVWSSTRIKSLLWSAREGSYAASGGSKSCRCTTESRVTSTLLAVPLRQGGHSQDMVSLDCH